MELENILDEFERNVKKLVGEHEALKKQHARTLRRHEELKAGHDAQKRRIATLEKNLKVDSLASLVKTQLSEDTKAKLVSEINTYIKHVDYCIKLLGD